MRTFRYKKMNDQTREHISSLMDGEISRETSRFLVRRLGTDEDLCATWARYHLVRDCLRHQDGGLSADDLCSRVNKALADEPRIQVQRRSLRWLKPAVGTAIAASVTLMAVLAVGPRAPGPQAVPADLSAAAELEPFTSPEGLGAANVTQQASLSGNSRMTSYLLRHYQAAGSSNGKGIVFFVPVMNRSAQTMNPDAQNGQDETDTKQGEQQK